MGRLCDYKQREWRHGGVRGVERGRERVIGAHAWGGSGCTREERRGVKKGATAPLWRHDASDGELGCELGCASTGRGWAGLGVAKQGRAGGMQGLGVAEQGGAGDMQVRGDARNEGLAGAGKQACRGLARQHDKARDTHTDDGCTAPVGGRAHRQRGWKEHTWGRQEPGWKQEEGTGLGEQGLLLQSSEAARGSAVRFTP